MKLKPLSYALLTVVGSAMLKEQGISMAQGEEDLGQVMSHQPCAHLTVRIMSCGADTSAVCTIQVSGLKQTLLCLLARHVCQFGGSKMIDCVFVWVFRTRCLTSVHWGIPFLVSCCKHFQGRQVSTTTPAAKLRFTLAGYGTSGLKLQTIRGRVQPRDIALSHVEIAG